MVIKFWVPLLIFGLSFIVLSQNTQASVLNNVFPNTSVFVTESPAGSNNFTPNSDSVNGFIEVSRLGSGNSLSATTTAVDVYFSSIGPKTITIQSYRSCGAPDWQASGVDGSLTTLFTVASDSGNYYNSFYNDGSCSAPNITLNVTATAGDIVDFGPTPTNNLYRFRIYADVGAPYGFVNAFKVIGSSGSLVTTPNNTGGVAGTADSFFALQRRPGTGSGERTFNIGFAPDCGKYGINTNVPITDSRFVWFDDDWNTIEGGQLTFQMKFQQRLKSSSAWSDIPSARISSSNLDPPTSGWYHPRTANNGSGSNGSVLFSGLNTAYAYRVLWRNVDGENGLRYSLPFSDIGQQVTCNSPPIPGAICDAYSSRVANGGTVNVGDAVDVNVRAFNNGSQTWQDGYLVYIYEGAPVGGYVQKFSTKPDSKVSPPTAGGILSPGQLGPVVSRGNADTSTPTAPGLPRTYTYNVYHLISFAAGTWEALGTCSFSVNVVQPFEPNAQIIGVPDCSGINIRAYWTPTRNINITVRLVVNGVPSDHVFADGEERLIGFNALPASIPIHLPSYYVEVYANGEYQTGQTFTGNCVSISCSPNAMDYELGDPTPLTLRYTVTNLTNRTDGNYDVALSSPPGGTITGPLTAGGRDFNTPPFSPTNSTTVTGTLTPTSFTASCLITVVRYPYVKAYGADIMAGGGFGPICNTRSGIFARMRPINQHNAVSNKSGSGSQLGAFAWDNISGLASAELRSTPPSATMGNGLHFAGRNGYDLTSQTAVMGGNLTGDPVCLPDYYNETQYPVGDPIRVENATGNINNNTGFDNKQVFYNYGTPPATVKTATMNNYTGKTTFYVNGDLEINGDIIYKNSSGYGSIASIPNFTIVVLGNIYVDRKVTQLDGIYIAQPLANGTKGMIYTCATSTAGYTADTAVYANCSGGYGVAGLSTPKLTVNGSFIAQKVILNRAVNTLSNSIFQEPQATSSASEVFNFTPEVFISPPIFRPNGGPTSGNYQSIAILPPIL